MSSGNRTVRVGVRVKVRVRRILHCFRARVKFRVRVGARVRARVTRGTMALVWQVVEVRSGLLARLGLGRLGLWSKWHLLRQASKGSLLLRHGCHHLTPVHSTPCQA